MLSIQKIAVALRSNNINEFYQSLTSKLVQPEYFNHLKEFDNHYMSDNKIKYNNSSKTEDMLKSDQLNYLPNNIMVKIDRMSMSQGLEVRSPLLDYRLLNFANKISISSKIQYGIGKIPLRKLLNEKFPNELISFKKHPFLVPIADWLRGDLFKWGRNLVLNGELIKMGFFNESEIDKIFFLHKNKRKNYEEFIWNILMFENWINTIHK